MNVRTASQKQEKTKVLRRISSGHQVTLPPHFMKMTNLHIGDMVEIIEEEGRVVVQPAMYLDNIEKKALIQKINNIFDGAPSLDIDEQALIGIIDEERDLARNSLSL